jgi:hypothetical protein
MKQTAIDWLIEQIKNDQFNKVKTNLEWSEIFKQAKEIEKEQIIFSNYNGQSVGKGLDVNIKKFLTHAEQYYNKTYKSKQDEKDSTNNTDRVL